MLLLNRGLSTNSVMNADQLKTLILIWGLSSSKDVNIRTLLEWNNANSNRESKIRNKSFAQCVNFQMAP